MVGNRYLCHRDLRQRLIIPQQSVIVISDRPRHHRDTPELPDRRVRRYYRVPAVSPQFRRCINLRLM